MRTFKDNQGRSWTVDVSVSTVKRVKSLLDVDLLSIASGKLIDQLVADPILIVDVLYVVIKPEADKLGITDENFGSSMGGDCIEQATTALLEALIGFFPSAQDRANLKRVLDAINKAMDKARTLATERLANIDQIAEAAVLQAMKSGT